MRRGLLGCLLVALVALATIASAQTAMQDKMALVKDAVAANQAKLKAYTYLQHTQIFYKGEMKSQKNSRVVTGPDGKPQKTSIDPPAPPPQQQSGRRGRLKEDIKDKKVGEMKEYMEKAQQLIEQYVPPNPQKMQAAFSSGAAALSEAGPGMIKLTFSNYVVSGDSMVLVFNQQAKKLASLNVNSYLGDEKDVVTLAVTFASLPDGTNYTALTDLVAKAKDIEVKTTNDTYQKL
jgi:methionine-rich copper-binding protein CopC